MIATSRFLAALECTKIRFRPMLCREPRWGKLTALPQLVYGGLLLRRREGGKFLDPPMYVAMEFTSKDRVRMLSWTKM